MNLQERLRATLGVPKRGTQARIARLTEKSSASVTAWFTNPEKVQTLPRADAEKICAEYAPWTNPAWLAEGIGPRFLKAPVAVEEPGSQYPTAYAAQKASTPPMFGVVPLISWVAAGQWTSIGSVVSPEHAEWYPCPVKHGPRTYALRVRGLSMFNPGGERSFSDGDIIFSDPDVQAVNRSLVVVRLDDEDEATFKRLLIDGHDRFLEALNPSWPDRIMHISGQASMCGVVIAKSEIIVNNAR